MTCFDKDTNTGDLFPEYVNMILKFKQESSGYPSWVQIKTTMTDTLRSTGAQGEFFSTRQPFKKCRRRNLAELILNSMCGKWAQNQIETKTTIVDSEKEFYELLTCNGAEVKNLVFPNDDVECVSWKYSEDNIAIGNNVNMAAAAYVTTEARLKL